MNIPECEIKIKSSRHFLSILLSILYIEINGLLNKGFCETLFNFAKHFFSCGNIYVYK